MTTRRWVVAFDMRQTRVKEFSRAYELSGRLSSDSERKLMHLVVESDKETIEDGKLVSAALNQGFSSFTPDLLFEKLVKEYSMAQHLYGEKLIRLLSGYASGYLKKNIVIPEFKRELRERLKERFERLRENGYLDKEGTLTQKAVELASFVLYLDEIEHIRSKGIGTKINQKHSVYGDKDEGRKYRKGDKYRDIGMRQSIKRAIRRQHRIIEKDDLRVFDRKGKGSIELIYAIDASGSMRGKKIEMAKRAGIALAYTAISQQDRVGLIVFGSRVRELVAPTKDFVHIIGKITGVTASSETNISATIQKAVELFSRDRATKHLILLTDCLPTSGMEPEKETLDAAAYANSQGVTISVVGISLDTDGRGLAEQVAEIGKGRLYIAESLKELDVIVLRDYYSVA